MSQTFTFADICIQHLYCKMFITKQITYKITLFKLFITCCLFLFSECNILAQNIYIIENNKVINKLKLKKDQNINEVCNNINNKYINKGFLSANTDSVQKVDSNYKIFINKGNLYFIDTIECFENSDKKIEKFSFTYKHKKYKPQHINSLKNKILEHYKNNGFLKAQIQTSTSFYNDNNISHKFIVITDKQFTYSKIQNKNLKKRELNYIANITHIKPNKICKQTDIDNFAKNLTNNNFYSLDSLHIKANNSKIMLSPFLHKSSKNKISALLGIESNKGNKTNLTGNVDVLLNNTLKMGEVLAFNWQKYQQQSQLLLIKTEFPFLFNLPLGTKINFELNKQDSNFLTKNYRLGLFVYPLSGFETTAYYENNYYQTINSQDSNTYITHNLYGTDILFKHLDNNYLPTSGILTNIDFSVGTNQTETSDKFILQTKAKIKYYFTLPFGNCKIQNLFGLKYSEKLNNIELFKLGGIKSIRGFNEYEVLCKAFNISSFEYRIPIAKQSYINTFYDFGVFQSLNKQTFNLQSLGLGLLLNTKAGVLSVIYAIGKYDNQAINIKNGKIHIGYSALF